MKVIEAFLNWMDRHGNKVILVAVALIVLCVLRAAYSGELTQNFSEPLGEMGKGEFLFWLFIMGTLTRGK